MAHLARSGGLRFQNQQEPAASDCKRSNKQIQLSLPCGFPLTGKRGEVLNLWRTVLMEGLCCALKQRAAPDLLSFLLRQD